MRQLRVGTSSNLIHSQALTSYHLRRLKKFQRQCARKSLDDYINTPVTSLRSETIKFYLALTQKNINTITKIKFATLLLDFPTVNEKIPKTAKRMEEANATKNP